MKLTLFQSAEGDCLLVTGKDGKNMLVDGGMIGSYRTHVAPTLSALREQGQQLDLVYVSHIDEDHIAGVLRMVEDLVDWRVHDFKVAHGEPGHPPPRSVRPPEIAGIWHNSFHAQVGDNAGPIESLLAATAAVLSGADDPALREAAEEHRALAASTTQALKLSRRIGARQLKIPLNKEFQGKLMMVRAAMPKQISFGTVKVRVLGPRAADLEKLREDWNRWLQTVEGQRAVVNLDAASQEDEGILGQAAPRLFGAFAHNASALAAALKTVGDRNAVTPPNLASLMLLLTEAGKTVLLTGDGHWEDILKGLKHHKLLGAAGLHVTVLKAQHHGALANFHPDFCKLVTADHYIFCGNGSHDNPELDVIRMVVNSRIGPKAVRSAHPKAGDPFTLWFNSSAKVSAVPAHMKKVETLAKNLATKNPGKITVRFLSKSQVELMV
jgi:hypothetical protein